MRRVKKALELEMGADAESEAARRAVVNDELRFAEGVTAVVGARADAGIGAEALQPGVELVLGTRRGRAGSSFVAPEHLGVMGEPGQDEHVGELDVQGVVEGGVLLLLGGAEVSRPADGGRVGEDGGVRTRLEGDEAGCRGGALLAVGEGGLDANDVVEPTIDLTHDVGAPAVRGKLRAARTAMAWGPGSGSSLPVNSLDAQSVR